jgi:hypothetical protein
VPIVLKIGSLNLLEHSGPVQGCNGIALPFTDNMDINMDSLTMEQSIKRCTDADITAQLRAVSSERFHIVSTVWRQNYSYGVSIGK